MYQPNWHCTNHIDPVPGTVYQPNHHLNPALQLCTCGRLIRPFDHCNSCPLASFLPIWCSSMFCWLSMFTSAPTPTSVQCWCSCQTGNPPICQKCRQSCRLWTAFVVNQCICGQSNVLLVHLVAWHCWSLVFDMFFVWFWKLCDNFLQQPEHQPSNRISTTTMLCSTLMDCICGFLFANNDPL